MWKETFIKALTTLKAHREYEKAIKEYKEKPWYLKMGGKSPAAPTENWQCICASYIKQFSETHEYPKEISINWQQETVDDKCSGYPVLQFWTYQQGCYFVTIQAFNPDGSTTEWGCPYPYSECGLTGRAIEHGLKSEELKNKYEVFDNLILEFKEFIKNNQSKLQ